MRFTKRLTVSEVPLKFPKFATNFAISLRSCQSNCELGREVVNFTTNLNCWEVKKFIPREVHTIRCKCLGIFLEVVVRWLRITGFKMGYETLNSGTRELTLKCKLKCYFKPMNNPLGISPSKGKQGTTRGKEKIFWPWWESNPRPTD